MELNQKSSNLCDLVTQSDLIDPVVTNGALVMVYGINPCRMNRKICEVALHASYYIYT